MCTVNNHIENKIMQEAEYPTRAAIENKFKEIK